MGSDYRCVLDFDLDLGLTFQLGARHQAERQRAGFAAEQGQGFGSHVAQSAESEDGHGAARGHDRDAADGLH